MIFGQNIFNAAVVSNTTTGATLSVTASAVGADYIQAYFDIGQQSNATAVPTAIALQSGTTSTGPWTTYTNFQTASPYTNQVASLTSTYVAANTNGVDSLTMGFSINNNANPYWKALVSPGYTQAIGIKILMSRLEQAPWVSTVLTSATSFGLAQQPLFG